MKRPRSLLLQLALGFCGAASAQVSTTETVVPPGVQVERLAPQLLTFSGSPANFTSLVTGLAQGTQITLSSIAPDGFTELVTFTPAGTMSATVVAQTLEAARQQLISRGIGAPTPSQLAAVLAGGTLQISLGDVPVPAVLPGIAISGTPLPGTVIPGALVPGTVAGVFEGTFIQPDGTVIGTIQPRGNTSDNPILRHTSETPPRGLAPIPGAAQSAPFFSAPAVPAIPPGLRNGPAPPGGGPAGFAVRR
jgi:hypothetical protein